MAVKFLNVPIVTSLSAAAGEAASRKEGSHMPSSDTWRQVRVVDFTCGGVQSVREILVLFDMSLRTPGLAWDSAACGC